MDEQGWLIEFPGPLWLGYGWTGGKVSTRGLKLVGADEAIRFCRKQDAEQMLEALRAGFPSGNYDRAIVTEHGWYPPRAAAKEARDDG